MRVEIDQSGKVEQLDTDTVIAYANGKSNAVVIKAGLKRRLIQHLRPRLYPGNEPVFLIFVVAIYILLEKMPNGTTLIIDEEYTGKESYIRKVLETLLNKRFHGKWLGNIRFERIGKGSPAHNLCYQLHRKGQHRGYRSLKFDEIAKYLE